MSFSLKEKEILDVLGYDFTADKTEDSKTAKKDDAMKADISTESESDAKVQAPRPQVQKKRKSVAVISKKRNV